MTNWYEMTEEEKYALADDAIDVYDGSEVVMSGKNDPLLQHKHGTAFVLCEDGIVLEWNDRGKLNVIPQGYVSISD